ncbi:Crp/Fnr family transcriptional regulator [soil metagenome]
MSKRSMETQSLTSKSTSLVRRRPASNRLLAGLPPGDRKHFLAGCETVNLEFSDVLYRAAQPIEHVYFPTDSVVSLVSSLDGQSSLEVGMIGDEGMVGSPLVLGMSASPLVALVQASGPALRMEAETFILELERSEALHTCMKRYIHVLMSQFAQTAACIRLHMIEARLARWMLMSQDRAHSDSFHLTHEFLAQMLGIRREGVTTAASALRDRNLIRYHRGDIQVLDREGLMAASCACYHTDKEVYRSVFG